MKITPVKTDGLAHEYRVTVPASVIDKQLENELHSISQRAKVPGFRPGKIPMPVLRQRYGKDVMDSVLWETVNKTTREVLAEKNLRPSTKPDVNIVDYKEGEDLVYDLSLEVLPEVPTLDYSKITVAEYTFDIAESEIEEALERLASSRKHWHESEKTAKAKEGDMVVIDFLGKRDGTPFDGGKGENFQLELGSAQFIPGFEEQLVGAKAGDKRTVKVTFPEVYHSKDLAGAEAEFDVTVHSVHHSHKPELNDAFAKDMNFESLDKIKDAIRQQIQDDYGSVARNRAKKELFDWLDVQVKFDVPPQMLKMEFEAVWQQLQEAKKKGDPSLDKPEAELRTEYQGISERRVRLGILLAEIGRKENIQVNRDELSRAVMDQARMFPGQEQKVFEFYQKNPQHVEELKGPIIEDKVVDFILSKVKRNEKKVTLEELANEDGSASGESAPKKKSSAKKSEKSEKKSDAEPASEKKAAAGKKKK